MMHACKCFKDSLLHFATDIFCPKSNNFHTKNRRKELDVFHKLYKDTYRIVASRSTSWLVTPHVTNWIKFNLWGFTKSLINKMLKISQFLKKICDMLKVSRSQNKIVEPKLLPKNERTNLFFYPDGQFWAENNLT